MTPTTKQITICFMHGPQHTSQAVINPGWKLNPSPHTPELPVRGEQEMWFVLMHMNNTSVLSLLSDSKHAHVTNVDSAFPGYIFDGY